jgi:hypothetical protein
MNNKFEDDEVLAQLSKAARKIKSPKLDEGIIQSAISSKPNVGRRKFSAPTLMFNLAGGAAVLAGVFVFTGSLGSTNQEVLSSGTTDQSSKISAGALALARGNVKITEEDLLARDGKSLAEYGQSAVGNYVSNNPSEYVDEIWTGKGGASEGNLWVFVVTDDVYIANGNDRVRLSSPFTQDKVISYADQLASSSDADGIRLLIQGDSNVLYPIVVPVNQEQGSLYTELRDYILSDTFTKVPTL